MRYMNILIKTQKIHVFYPIVSFILIKTQSYHVFDPKKSDGQM